MVEPMFEPSLSRFRAPAYPDPGLGIPLPNSVSGHTLWNPLALDHSSLRTEDVLFSTVLFPVFRAVPGTMHIY